MGKVHTHLHGRSSAGTGQRCMEKNFVNGFSSYFFSSERNSHQHQSGAAEAWWAHNPQVPGSKPGSDNSEMQASISAP